MSNNEPDSNNSLISLRDVFRILFRHKRKALATFGGLLLLSFVALVMMPKSYVSESKIYVRVGRDSVDPTAHAGGAVSVQESRESEIQSVMDLLTSQIIYEQVIDRIGEESINRCSLRESSAATASVSLDPLAALRGAISYFLPSDNVGSREKAVRLLERWVNVGSSKNSSVIRIFCKCGDPAVAQRVVQEFVDVYRGEHARVNRTVGSAKFLEEQVAVLQKRLDEATQRLRDAKNAVGLVSLESQKKIIELQITNLNQDIVETESSLSTAQSRIDALRVRIPDVTVAELQESGNSLSGTAVDEMRDRLYELQIRERELMAKYQPAHPSLKAVRQAASEARQILTRQELAIEVSTSTSLQAKLDSLKTKLVSLDQKLRDLNENEVVISEIEREMELLTKNYRNYKENLELARYDQELLSSDITNINVVQPATFVAKAVSPRKSIVLGLGLIMATFGGLGAALLGEVLDNSFATPEQLESKLDLPVLLSIPHINRRRVLLS